MVDSMEKIVNLCKNRGFIFAGSEIYGGLANTWDYGPLGVELKNNVKEAWRKKFIQEQKDIVGLDTGYQNLNEKTLGFQASQLIILAARPGMGKSALAMNIAANIARLNNGGHARVAVFNLEMSYDQLAERMIASEANIDSKTLKSGKFTSVQSKAFNAASARLSQIDVEFDDSGNTTVEDIRTKCRKLKASDGGLDFVVIDYLQL